VKIEDFGAALLETGDLDPVYTVVTKANMQRDQLRRWCFAYWCFYHAGLASYLSEKSGAEFWIAAVVAAQNTTESPVGGRWPRGKERRHFRGDKCVESIRWFANSYTRPESPAIILEGQAPSLKKIRDHVLAWPMFGPWISFKVADMLDRVLGVPVIFDQADVFMFDSPRDAAIEWFDRNEHRSNPPTNIKIKTAVNHLQNHLKYYKAPPFQDRPLNLQEFETILCKWKSHHSGHYPIGNDVREIRHGLAQWKNVSPTALALLDAAVPLELAVVDWKYKQQQAKEAQA
jgi:hypothetical protein